MFVHYLQNTSDDFFGNLCKFGFCSLRNKQPRHLFQELGIQMTHILEIPLSDT
jgi:hypothetical protein